MEQLLSGSESPFIKYWRPCMAWMYAIICIFDFLVGPILFMIIQGEAASVAQWTPMTLRSGGIFHLAMGAIVAAVGWGRTQEKISYMEYINHIGNVRSGINNGGMMDIEEETDAIDEEPPRKPRLRRKAIVSETSEPEPEITEENKDK